LHVIECAGWLNLTVAACLLWDRCSRALRRPVAHGRDVSLSGVDGRAHPGGMVGSILGQAEAPHSLADVPPHAFASALDVPGRDCLVDGGVLFFVDPLARGQIYPLIRRGDTCSRMFRNKVDKDRNADVVTRERDSPMELQIGVDRLRRSLTVVKSLKRGLYRGEMLTPTTRGG
jgi:hypothetical protein